MTRNLFLTGLATLLLSATAQAGIIMYGGNGGHNNVDSINDGWLVTIDQATGAVTPVGHPAGVSRLTGLAIEPDGSLFATTQGSGGFPPPPGPVSTSNVIQINPATGAIIGSAHQVTVGGVGISIADLAVQPGTGTLYGIRNSADQLGGQGRLYTINPATGAATFVGDTGHFFGSIAFAPGGALYMSSADLDFATGNLLNISLRVLNPATAASLSFVATNDFFGALGIRPSDGVIFGGTGDSSGVFTVNPTTGGETLVGSTGRNFVGDFAFQVPEPGTLALLGIGLLAVAYARRQRAH